MQRDFHYYVIRILAEKAGFIPEEAQIIAYSSEYIDDAVEHKKMKVKGNFYIDYPRYDGEFFDPICTAHRGVQYVEGLKADVQRKIYISFHFIPPKAFVVDESFEYITVPNGGLARELVTTALIELSKSKGKKRFQNLIKLGIALHSFSDTWAHQGFSGRHSSLENDIEDIEIFENGSWIKPSQLKSTFLNITPDIGHGEADDFPDLSHLHWKYKSASSGKITERKNDEIFLDAAFEIFKILGGFYKNEDEWKSIEPKLNNCFCAKLEINDKISLFQKLFPEIGFFYDPNQWRNDALALEKSSLHEVLLDSKKKKYKIREDMKWFYFHIEAFKQRNFMLKRIPQI